MNNAMNNTPAIETTAPRAAAQLQQARAEIIQAQRQILLNLVACENLIGDLYDTYEKLFPRSAALWSAMAADERSHARVLVGLTKLLDAGHLFWNIGLFREDAVAGRVATVRTALERARQGASTESEAFRTAMRIEAARVSSRFYNLVKCDAREFACIAGILARVVAAHAQRLSDWIINPQPAASGEVYRMDTADAAACMAAPAA
jgi:hypothetical protein